MIPRKFKKGHLPTFVSRKSVNRFIEFGLRGISAKPHLYFHQTLTFPAIIEAKPAKRIFNRFIKGVSKFYQRHELAVVYAQEARKSGAVHFHVCFLFLSPENLPFHASRIYRDFRTDIFRRWNALNEGKAVHHANLLKEHSFNRDSLEYFTQALIVADRATSRAQTNWWGTFNKHLILRRSSAPSTREKKDAFRAFFKPEPLKLPAVDTDAIKTRETQPVSV